MMIYLYSKSEHNHNKHFYYNTIFGKYYCYNNDINMIMSYNDAIEGWTPTILIIDVDIPPLNEQIILNFSNENNMPYRMCENYIEKIIFDNI